MKLLIAVPALAALAGAASILPLSAATPPKPKITAEQAKVIGARAVHGKAKSAKYEFEDGRWQYAVIVISGKQMYEVEVNSTTGKVMDTEKTTATEEAKEAAADRAKATGHKSAAGAEKDEPGEKGEKAEKD